MRESRLYGSVRGAGKLAFLLRFISIRRFQVGIQEANRNSGIFHVSGKVVNSLSGMARGRRSSAAEP
jgi:hypothetical protein